MPASLAALYRYPVKGLSPEPVAAASLDAGGFFPGDRLYAVENGPSGFEAAAPVHYPKIKYLMLMKNPRLARLRTRYEAAASTLTVVLDEKELCRGDLKTPEGRAAVEATLAAFCAGEMRGPARVLEAPGWRFTDSRSGFVSLINLASVADLGRRMGRSLDPLRFRGNLHVEGMPAWSEFDLVGRRIRVGSAVLEGIKRIERCAATNVDPDVGIRDCDPPAALLREFGHRDCGVYFRVVEGGALAPGAAVALL